jgi:hypothetical protein
MRTDSEIVSSRLAEIDEKTCRMPDVDRARDEALAAEAVS